MSDKPTYQVTAPLVAAKSEDGRINYYYRGALLPSELPAAELDRLVELGLVDKSTPLPHVVADHPTDTVATGEAAKPQRKQ